MSSPNEVEVTQYSSEYKPQWDSFISAAKNGVFLFNRDYMEYHKDRFTDHSLLFFSNHKLVGLLPANLVGDALQSHGGLTFGGVISSYQMKTPLMLAIFKALIQHCKAHGIKEVVYKPVPYIYQSIPADEDLYALFLNNAKIAARNVSSCIALACSNRFDSNRNDNIRKAKNNNLTVEQSADYDSFMKIEEEALIERHGVKPVHSIDEIKLLAQRFPDNIKLFASFKDGEMLAGVIMYESKNVAHMQYAANSKAGWGLGAQDIIEDYLINQHYIDKKYFDFGISTENLGQVLNLGLIKRKENFGANAVVYDTYHVII